MLYSVYAYQNGKVVCEVATIGAGLQPYAAEYFARELRQEFPNSVVAILPAK